MTVTTVASDREICTPLPVLGRDVRVPLVTGGEVAYAALDYAASAPALQRVWDDIAAYAPYYGSVHRGAGYLSQLSTDLFEQSRETVARFLGCRDDDQVIFTRSTTDSLNLLAAALPAGTRVFVFETEHHASLLPWERADGAEVSYLAAPRTPEQAVAALDVALHGAPKGPKLVCVTGASNVTGEIWPVRELAAAAHRHGARIVLDAAQLAPHHPRRHRRARRRLGRLLRAQALRPLRLRRAGRPRRLAARRRALPRRRRRHPQGRALRRRGRRRVAHHGRAARGRVAQRHRGLRDRRRVQGARRGRFRRPRRARARAARPAAGRARRHPRGPGPVALRRGVRTRRRALLRRPGLELLALRGGALGRVRDRGAGRAVLRAPAGTDAARVRAGRARCVRGARRGARGAGAQRRSGSASGRGRRRSTSRDSSRPWGPLFATAPRGATAPRTAAASRPATDRLARRPPGALPARGCPTQGARARVPSRTRVPIRGDGELRDQPRRGCGSSPARWGCCCRIRTTGRWPVARAVPRAPR